MTTLPSKTAFLAPTPCAHWQIQPLAGDASTRSYDRLTGPDGQTAILMVAGPDAATSVPPFVAIAQHLTKLGLCAPTILAQTDEPGYLLLSDLGRTDIAQHLAARPDDEHALYSAAIDVLLALHNSSPPEGLTRLTSELGAQMLDPLFEWFAPATPSAQRQRIEASITTGLAEHAGPANTLSLRDFHAENLIWRPHLTGTDRIGLLDFQDAFIAPSAYDLVSLLRDARRNVSDGTRRAAIAQFARGIGQDAADVEAACAILGLQRNLRILGIFARLAKRDGKAHYTALIPRVLGHIRADLEHPAAQDLRATLAPALDTTAA
ncbi:aminoglycoside phosphotransferase family protein [Flavimaricola marinus]|uniref:Phosphotransferase enzyme family protein n=1 Tax=Flavimaricola marinus TaxID=1819565 RepID=A0A238LCA7_9RHOB|nr:phosphotransferase [Flavimaricola marinus]SMY07212.1 Phosphotransferase enzyme family protein [Flavimaricola marinus]